MNKITIPLIAFFLLLGAKAKISAEPLISFEETELDAGAFSEDSGSKEFIFRFTNAGDSTLVITGLRTSCGCTVANYDRQPVAPGESREIHAVYDPTGRLGRFEKSIYVTSNAEPRKTELRIKGVVVGGKESVRRLYPEGNETLALQKGTALAGNVNRGRTATMFVNAYNQSTDTLVPSVEDVPPYIRVIVEPQEIPPGEQGTFIIYFTSSNAPDWGRVETTLSIHPTPGGDVIELPVVANVVEDFSKLSDSERLKAAVATVSPERLVVEKLTVPGEPREVYFSVKNTGRTPLEIRRIYSEDAGISVETPKKAKIKPGKSLRIPVVITPDKLPGALLNGIVTIITNSPSNSVETLRIVGEIERKR